MTYPYVTDRSKTFCCLHMRSVLPGIEKTSSHLFPEKTYYHTMFTEKKTMMIKQQTQILFVRQNWLIQFLFLLSHKSKACNPSWFITAGNILQLAAKLIHTCIGLQYDALTRAVILCVWSRN